MIFRAAERLDVFPMSHVVVVDDTAGRHRGRPQRGRLDRRRHPDRQQPRPLAEEVDRLDRRDLASALATVAADLKQAGAHYVIESVADLLPVLDQITDRLAD